MNVVQFENIGTVKDGEAFEWNVPGWVLNHRYSTKRSDVFTLSRVPGFKFCLTLRPYTDVSVKSVSFNLQLHRIPVVQYGSERSAENPESTIPDMDVRFILFKTDSVYKWSGTMKMKDNRLTANFPEVATYDCMIIQCIMVSPMVSQPEMNASQTQVSEKSEETERGLAHGLSSLLNSGNFSDVTLSVEDKEFNVHRCILAARSNVFSAMFTHDLKEKLENRIVIQDISSDVIQQLLKYVYTDEIDKLTPQEYLSLFTAADKYDIVDLRKKCAHHLKKNLPLDSLIVILIAADLHHEDDLKEAAIQLFLKNAVTVMNSEEWLSCMKNHTRLANTVLLRLAKQ